MIERMTRFGNVESVEDGSFLFRRGERSVDFFVVLDGAVDIFDEDRGRERRVHRHEASQFTGELDLFNDRKILVSGRFEGPGRVRGAPRRSFRAMVAAEPDIAELIMRAFILRRVGLLQHEQGGVTLVGSQRSADTVRLNAFLTRNGYPHRIIDTDSDTDAASFLDYFKLAANDLPVVIADGTALRNPRNLDLAEALGLTIDVDPSHVFDVAVVGAGPSGLAAAVYAASEGLDTVVLEGIAPGGQAGTSSKIENYLGFPTGISGQALAGRAQVQAQKFGAKLAVARAVDRIECETADFRLMLEDGASIRARAVIAASGARYRRIEVDGLARFEGAGVHYAATAMEAKLCAGAPVVVVGGGNSAGQAALFLSRHAAHVYVLVRGGGLAATMSRYLIERIEAAETVSLHPWCEISALGGDTSLEWVAWRERDRTEPVQVPAQALFVMIGAIPNSQWLDGCADLDAKGFVITGTDGGSPFATSRPGLFAVGDLRAGSVKRVASGVGEGSVVIQFVHRWLEQREGVAST